jgi:hypothetical protein
MKRFPLPPVDRSVVFEYQLELPLEGRDYEQRDIYELERSLEDAFDILCARIGVSRGRTTAKIGRTTIYFSVEVRTQWRSMVIAWKQRNDSKVISRAAYHFQHYAVMMRDSAM